MVERIITKRILLLIIKTIDFPYYGTILENIKEYSNSKFDFINLRKDKLDRINQCNLCIYI